MPQIEPNMYLTIVQERVTVTFKNKKKLQEKRFKIKGRVKQVEKLQSSIHFNM